MRSYEPIWQHLKEHKVVTVKVAHRKLMNRVHRMVMKEKDMDLAYKVEEDITWVTSHSWNPETKELTMWLKPLRLIDRI